jgi:hypothetical protein
MSKRRNDSIEVTTQAGTLRGTMRPTQRRGLSAVAVRKNLMTLQTPIKFRRTVEWPRGFSTFLNTNTLTKETTIRRKTPRKAPTPIISETTISKAIPVKMTTTELQQLKLAQTFDFLNQTKITEKDLFVLKQHLGTQMPY